MRLDQVRRTCVATTLFGSFARRTVELMLSSAARIGANADQGVRNAVTRAVAVFASLSMRTRPTMPLVLACASV